MKQYGGNEKMCVFVNKYPVTAIYCQEISDLQPITVSFNVFGINFQDLLKKVISIGKKLTLPPIL